MNRLFPSTWLRPAPMAMELDRLIQDFWTSTSPFSAAMPELAAGALADGGPAWNVSETPTTFEIEMELPGLALENVEVTLEGRDLSIRGERKTAIPEGASWQRRERFHGKFSRSLHFGMDLDASRVAARLEQGVLSVTLPKAETAMARRIPIQVKSIEAKVQ
ncbi:MAG: Hsp20/alpha crystallin family protein [Planctomycetes bacterium]|jgi:HSP20 family protein|nr:Hsp20/alpha crystallin family protein [Planctomycetota bacterium]